MTLIAPALTRYAGPPAVPGYAVDEFLGRGATGVVWAATCRETGERVALKLVEPHGVADVDLGGLDREEALGRQVDGAHLVTVRGRVALDDGRLAFVMRLADGGSLRDVVTIRGALPLGEVVTALTPLASALAELHEADVVHVDVAPGNVLFTTDGRPMLADLSSAWLVDDGWPQRSLGTSGFAAPEVALGQPPVPASDVWSLGALAWYARTGGLTPPPWVGDLHWSPAAVGSNDAGEGTGTLDDVEAAVGPELAPLLVQMLADDPDARPGAVEVASALYRAAVPDPVVLVGHHPDPAAAVTTRIRREAAETRSRSQLREGERVERRRSRRERRRRRVRRLLVPWDRVAATTHVVSPPGSGRRRSWRLRLMGVALVGLVLAGGMLGLLRLTGGPLDLSASPVVETTPGVPVPASATAIPETAPVATSRSETPATGWPVTGLVGDGSPPSRGDVTHDPVAALQQLADLRARALVAADPALLLGAEAAASSAYENDARTVTRLREQRQRYADLAFTVRSADVVSASPASVVLRAVVDRSAYQVLGEEGTTHQVGAASGTLLRYTLSSTDAGWRLTEVGPP